VATTLGAAWWDAVLHPTRLGEHARAEPRAIMLVLPACAGVLQSFLQGMSNNVGLKGSVLMVVAFAIPIGAVWGLLQVHLLAGCLWAVARRDGQWLPYRTLRHVWSLAMAPAATAVFCWVATALIVGSKVFVDPSAWSRASVSSGESLFMSLLLLGSGLAMMWGFVLLTLGVREVTGRSTLASVWTVMQALVVLLCLSFVVVIALVLAGA